MRSFSYLRDPLCVTGCAAYAANRWLALPHVASPLLHNWFNDFWLIPCALPPVLWLHRRLGWRFHDRPPQWLEILGHLIVWSILFEWIGPKWVPRATGDILDVLAYSLGAVFAGLWWQGIP